MIKNNISKIQDLRRCKNCKSTYSKDDYWCEIEDKTLEIKGLCDFCRPDNPYYMGEKYVILKQKK